MYPDDSKEGARRTKGNLSWWNTADVLGEGQDLNEHI